MAIDRGTSGYTTRVFPAGNGSAEIGVISIGDSTLTEDGLSEGGMTWLELVLGELADDENGFVYTNAANPGGRLSHAVHQLRAPRQEAADVVVIAVGTNDITSLRRLLDLGRYRRRYRRLLTAASDRAGVVVVTGVGDLSLSPRFHHQPILRPLKPLTKLASWYVNRQVVKAVRKQRKAGANIHVIDPRKVEDDMATGRQWLFSPDHFHPNDRGHRLWAHLAAPKLAEALATLPVKDDGARDATRPRLVPSRLGFARIRTAGPRDKTRAVVLIPDAPNTLENYDELFATLQGAQHKNGSALSDWPRIVALEMPGLGHSSANDRFDFSLRMGAEWIEGVLAHEGVDEVLIATSCINGLWAAKFAQAYPERVRGLVLGQTPSLAQIQAWGTETIRVPIRWPVIGPIVLRRLRRKIVSDWYRQAAPEPTPQRHKLEEQAVRSLEDGAQWQLDRLYRSIMREKVDPLCNLATVTPTLLWGQKDETYHRPPRDRELIDTGHFPDLEDPTRIVAELETCALAERSRIAEAAANA